MAKPRPTGLTTKEFENHCRMLDHYSEVYREAQDAVEQARKDLTITMRASYDAGVPITVISKVVGISRQWILKTIK
jgi:transposase-like protein